MLTLLIEQMIEFHTDETALTSFFVIQRESFKASPQSMERSTTESALLTDSSNPTEAQVSLFFTFLCIVMENKELDIVFFMFSE